MGQSQPASLTFMQRKTQQLFHLGQKSGCGGLGNAKPCRRKAKGPGVIKLCKQPQVDRLQPSQLGGKGGGRDIHNKSAKFQHLNPI